MNGAHLHLLVNHVSLFALIIGVGAFIASLLRRSSDLRVLAVVLFAIAGLFGWIAVESGEKAADLIKNIPDTQAFVEHHAQAAEWAFRSCITVAVLALVTEWSARKKPKAFRVLKWVLLVFAIHGTTVFMTTAYLGGLIRHSEVR